MKKKIILIMFLIICPFVFTIFSYYTTYEEFKNEDAYFKHNKFNVLTSVVNLLIEENYKNLSDTIVQEKIEGELLDIQSDLKIIDLSGNVLFSSKNQEQDDFVDLKQDMYFDESYENQNTNLIRISNPIVINNTIQGMVIFEIPKDILAMNSYVQKTNKVMLPIIIALTLASIIIFIIVIKIVVEIYIPVKRLNYYANEISKGNLDIEIKHMGKDEIKQCGIAFDRMKKELKESLDIQSEYEKSKKELIACISHDLKTPISSIRASIEGLIDGIVKDEKMQKKYYGIIHKKILSLDKLVDDLFHHSQMELKKLKVIKKDQYLNIVLEQIIKHLEVEFQASTKNLNVIRPFPNTLVHVDCDRICQVILNLIRNAEKYSDDGDEITIWCEVKENSAYIHIKDTGYGISKEDLPFIFNKFYRGEKARTSNLGGSGLGLAICKYIVEEHHGRIEVISQLGKGSTFTIQLPKV